MPLLEAQLYIAPSPSTMVPKILSMVIGDPGMLQMAARSGSLGRAEDFTRTAAAWHGSPFLSWQCSSPRASRSMARQLGVLKAFQDTGQLAGGWRCRSHSEALPRRGTLVSAHMPPRLQMERPQDQYWKGPDSRVRPA